MSGITPRILCFSHKLRLHALGTPWISPEKIYQATMVYQAFSSCLQFLKFFSNFDFLRYYSWVVYKLGHLTEPDYILYGIHSKSARNSTRRIRKSHNEYGSVRTLNFQL